MAYLQRTYWIKPWSNDRNMPTQHIATLLGATCCVRLATVLWHVGCCWHKFDHFQAWANNTQHVATHRNTVAKRTQHVAPNNVVICCVGMLRSFGQGFKTFYHNIDSCVVNNGLTPLRLFQPSRCETGWPSLSSSISLSFSHRNLGNIYSQKSRNRRN